MLPKPLAAAAAASRVRSPVAVHMSDVALLSSCGLLGAVAVSIASAAAELALGRAVSAASLLPGGIAIAAVPLGSALVRDRSRRAWMLGLLGATLSCAIVVFAFLVAPWRYDTSFDGVGYHQFAVTEIARGWNPWRVSGVPREHYSPDMLQYFPKGAWLVEAAIFRLTGRLEVAKGLHFVMLGAAGLAAFTLLRRLRAGLLASALVDTLAALNPVSACQTFTFYVDGLLASSFTSLVALAVVALLGGERVALVGAACATVVLVDVKLTGVPYAVVVWACFAAAALVGGGRRAGVAFVSTGGLACAVAMVFTGYNPYVTNTLTAGHPLHPAAGPHARNFVRASRPPGFDDMTRVERVFRSVFSSSSTDAPDGRPRLKLPFTVAGDEATKFHAPDVRVGGFGPFFGGALVLAVLAFLLAASAPGALSAALAAALMTGTVLITGEGWWARLAPQLWLVPLVLVIPGLRARRWAPRTAAALVLAVLVADAGLVAVNHLNRNRTVQAEIRAQLAELRSRGPVEVDLGPHRSVSERLTEAGLRWKEAAPLHCGAPARLAGTFFGRVCPAP